MTAALVLEAGADGVWACLETPDGSRHAMCRANETPTWAPLAHHVRREGIALARTDLRVTPEAIDARIERVGAVCIGLAQRAFERLAVPGRLALTGTIDINGQETAALADDELRTGLPPLLEARRIEGFAVSGANSNRNPLHEKQAAARIRELTGLHVLEARFWGDALDAGRRAMAAAHGLATLLVLRDLHHQAAAIQEMLPNAPTPRASLSDPALLAAILDAPDLADLAALLDWSADVGSLTARITRGERTYVCHCTDGAFEFESITLARRFADEHLREQWAGVAGRLGHAAGNVQVTSHDRYTFVRGKRGPVRVYLETIVTARAGAPACPPAPDQA